MLQFMKTRKIIYYLLVLASFGILISGCKKDNNSSTTTTSKFTGQQLDQVENSDVQDAIAEKTDQDIDKSIDQLQVTNYQPSTAKSLSASGSLVITVNHPDSTTFPKLISLVYTNFQDSTAVESFVKNGEIDVLVSLTGTDKQLVTRVLTFKHFSVTTDSTTFTINGVRTVARTARTFKFNGAAGVRFTATDNITANLSYAITKTGTSDTLKFTRIVSRLRKAYLHYDNFGGIIWRLARFRTNLSKDTLTFSGTVTGINEKGDPYTKTVSASTPLVVTFYLGTPIIISGTLDYTVTGTSAASYTVTFEEDPAHPRNTLITATNNTTLAVTTFDRRFGRKFRRWW
jgi:hypothetical protein